MVLLVYLENKTFRRINSPGTKKDKIKLKPKAKVKIKQSSKLTGMSQLRNLMILI